MNRKFAISSFGQCGRALAVIAALAILPSALFGADATSREVNFNIKAQPLASALIEFSKQSQLQIMSQIVDLSQRQVSGVSGRHTIAEALSQLLNNTGLGYASTAPNTIAITATPDSSGAANFELSDAESRAIRLAQNNVGDALPESSGSNKNESAELEEILVTAQKRSERLQDVPISVSMLGGEQLDHSSYPSLNDAIRTVPGVTMYENPQAGMSKISVRGVSSNPSGFNSSSTVGFYIDEIPFGFARMPFTPNLGSVYDLERVEVLRGPQGTLYGASSLNGVVRVLTQKADLSNVELKARTSVAGTRTGGDIFNGDLSLNVPIITDKAALRVTGGYTAAGGWIDRPADNAKDVNDERSKYIRAKLNAEPAENLSVELSGWISRSNRDASSQALDNGNTVAVRDEPLETRFDAFGLVVNYDFSFATLTSASSYVKFFSSSEFNNGLLTPGQGFFTRLTDELKAQELRLVSTSEGPWRWSLGGIYRDEDDSKNAFFNQPGLAPALQGNEVEDIKSTSYAVFGELTRSFLDDRLELTGGLRYFHDRPRYREVSSLDATVPADMLASRETKVHALTPRFVATFKPNSNTNLYASYGQGFRSGFTQAAVAIRLSASRPLPSVEPDKLTNYEVGAKGSLFDGVVTYEVAGYYIDWKDAVQVIGTPVLNLAGMQVGTVNAAINSEGISGPGFDASLTLRPSRQLQFGGTISWNDLKFDRDVRSSTAIVYPEGSRPPESAEMTASTFFLYDTPLVGDFTGELSGALNYSSRMITSAAVNTAIQRGDSLLTAQARFAVISPDGWTIALFGENLTNERGRIRPAAANPTAGSDRLRPRTIGIQLDYHF